MAKRIAWSRHEVALLFRAYEELADGAELNRVAEDLSKTLRTMAFRAGQEVDETYRNVNGMKMQLGNVQYLFTNGQKGLSGASVLIRQMYEIYTQRPAEFQNILKEALSVVDQIKPIEEAFFEYAFTKTRLSRGAIEAALIKASEFCRLKQPLLGITDVKEVNRVQQKIAEGQLLRFRYGKETERIREAVRVYYSFVKGYRRQTERDLTTAALPEAEPAPEQQNAGNTGLVENEQIESLTHGVECQVDFDVDSSYAFTRPISYSYNGITHLSNKWGKLYVELCGVLFADHHDRFMELMNGDIPGYHALAFADETNKDRQRMPRCFAPGYYVETHLSATAIVCRIRGIVHWLGLKDKLKIVYTRASRDTQEVPTDVAPEISAIQEPFRSQILSVTAAGFPHGIRPSSIIDVNKLKRQYQTCFGEPIPDSIDIPSLLSQEGIQSGEKVYILNDEQKQNLRQLIQSVFAAGYEVIYYSELLAKHGDLLDSCHLYEASLLRSVFASIMPNVICQADVLLANQDANSVEEITRAYGVALVLDYQQIKERCPYLTMDAIRWALTTSDRFVWSSQETYAQTDLIQLDSKEVDRVRDEIIPQIEADGFYSLARLPLEESCDLNSGISLWAVRDAMYNRHMARYCDRHGLIVTPKGVRLTSAQVLEAWCKGLDRVTVDEVEAYEYDLTGHHASLGLWAACNTMVRIDHDHFVADSQIDFDIDAIDRAISLFVGDRIVPITAVTSFTSFPEVPGYSWNLFLVESFLRRFSKRFTIDGGPAQTSYVGGICSIEKQFESYEDRLAHAVVQDGVALTEESIGSYLTERKYILRRSNTVRKVLGRALILTEQ